MLQGSQYSIAKDPGKDRFWSILEGCLGIAAVITPIAIVEIFIVISIGAIEYYTSNSSTLKDCTDINLDFEYVNIAKRLAAIYDANQFYIGCMFNDPNTYRDQTFTFNNKTYTLRDLANVKLPEPASEEFNALIAIICRQFRNQITIPEMIKMQFWDIYFVEDMREHRRFGKIVPPSIISFDQHQRSRLFDANNVGDGVRIFANDEIRQWNPDYVHAEAFGNNNNDLQSSYFHAINSFITQFPAALVYPWTITDKSVYSYRWYIMEGYSKIIDYVPEKFGVANGTFMNWLFIDDGAGNVVNRDGVMYRYDILNCGLSYFQNDFPKENQIPSDEKVILKSSDTKFLYPGCSDKLTSNRVYTNDFS